MEIFKFSLVLSLLTIGAHSSEEQSEKDEIHHGVNRMLFNWFQPNMEDICPRQMAPEQITVLNEKKLELYQCLNGTIDVFFNKLPDDITKDDFQGPAGFRKYFRLGCELSAAVFRCLRNVQQALDLCLDENGKTIKDNLFAAAPILHESACLQNGELLPKIAEHESGPKCIYHAYDVLIEDGFPLNFVSESNELFGSEHQCSKFKRIQNMFVSEINECSSEVLDLSKTILGRLCHLTKCQQVINDIDCY